MSEKLKQENEVDRVFSPLLLTKSVTVNNKNLNTPPTSVILDYVFSHLSSDQRPYLQVSIFGKTFIGFLDSGASTSIIGIKGWEVITHFNLHLTTDDSPDCIVANGEVW